MMFVTAALAAQLAGLDVHLACAMKKKACVEFKQGAQAADGLILGEKKPALTFSKKDITTAAISKDNRGHTTLSLVLTPEAARKNSDFTKAHIGQQMLVTLGDRVLVAPVIQQAVPADKLVLNFGLTEKAPDLLPWLSELTKKN